MFEKEEQFIGTTAIVCSETIKEGSVSNLENSIKRFIEQQNPSEYSFSCFHDGDLSDSKRYKAIIIYKK